MHSPTETEPKPGRSHWPLLGWLVIGGLFLSGLGRRDWWYPDEPDVALPSIEMAARGDWVVPTHNGEPWLDYPPLAYWGARVVGLATGRIDPFTTRLPMLVFAAVLLLVTARLGSRLGSREDGRRAALVLAATPLLWLQATNVQVDLGYATAQAVGLLCYLRGVAPEAGAVASWSWRGGGFGAFGLPVLAKGPLGLLLRGLVLTLWHGWNAEWRRLLQLGPLTLVALAVALPWYLVLGQRVGWDVLGREFYLQNFDRFQATNRGHGGKGAAYYVKALAGDFLPWVLLLGPAFFHGWRTRRTDRGWRLLAIWAVAPFVFFNLASTKRNVYLLPIYPALALLVAGWLRAELGPWARRWRVGVGRGWCGLWLVLGVILIAVAVAWSLVGGRLGDPLPDYPGMMDALWSPLLVLGLTMVSVGWWAGRKLRDRALHGWMGLAWGGALIAGVALHTVLPVVDDQRSYRPAAQWLVERVPEDGRIGYFWPGREAVKRPAWLCHLERRRLEFFADAATAEAWLSQDAGRLLITSPELAVDLPSTTTVAAWRISSTSWVVVSGGVAPAQ